MKLNEAIGITRNPYGCDDGTVREARLAVCNEVERLQTLEPLWISQNESNAKDNGILRQCNHNQFERIEELTKQAALNEKLWLEASSLLHECKEELMHYRDLIEQPLNVQELHYVNGAFDIKATHPLAASLFNEVCGLFISGGGENYFQMDGFHPKTGPINIIVQRQEGKNPAQLTVELRAELVEEKARSEKYRSTLIDTGCNDVFCDEARRSCRECPKNVKTPAQVACEKQAQLHRREPAWIVNDLGELGVTVCGRHYFLYKGDNLEYKDGLHDNGTPMMYRMVGKREFGETQWPQKWVVAGRKPEGLYTDNLLYTPGLSDGKPEDGDWRPLKPTREQKN